MEAKNQYYRMEGKKKVKTLCEGFGVGCEEGQVETSD